MIGPAVLLGLVVSLVTGVLIVASLAHNPRIWIGDAPREMQEAATPLSTEEKTLRIKWAIPILFSMVVIVPLVTFLLHRQTPLSYPEALGMMWIAWMILNLVDLVIIDWIIVVLWKPRWSVIQEVEHLYHRNTYGFHLRGFLIGTLGITVVSVVLASFVFVA